MNNRLERVIAGVCATFALWGCDVSKGREVRDERVVLLYFDNEYNGLKPGSSTLEDVLEELGEPHEVRPAGGGKNYFFEKVVVNFAGDNTTINTISVFNDPSYRCPNGIGVNDGIESVREKLGDEAVEKVFYDDTKGIFYWHDGEKVQKITLAHSAYQK